MNRQELVSEIRKKNSYLCVGLDTDIEKIPDFLKNEEDPVFSFNKAIIDATKDYCVAYKLNLAFYESLGLKGWEAMQKTLEYIPDNIFTIADAKRGDIGNTATMYAKAFFQQMNYDSVTVAPYMGKDSVVPFLEFENKWAIVLGLTSNEGSADFQKLELKSGEMLFEKVLSKIAEWGTTDNLMFVIGATRAENIGQVRKIIPNHFLLVPGVGAQGGDLAAISRYGFSDDCGLLVNSSRGIIYASHGDDFQEAAARAAKEIQQQMQSLLGEATILTGHA